MAKTNTEIIRDLEKNAATLDERLDRIRIDMDKLEKRLDELDRKLWTITCLFIAALLSLAATLIVQIVKK